MLATSRFSGHRTWEAENYRERGVLDSYRRHQKPASRNRDQDFGARGPHKGDIDCIDEGLQNARWMLHYQDVMVCTNP